MATVGISGQSVPAGPSVQSPSYWQQYLQAWQQFLANPGGQFKQGVEQGQAAVNAVPGVIGNATTNAIGLQPGWLQGLEVYAFLLLLAGLGLYGLLAPGRA
jgi:hypothetical protein